MTPVLEVVGAAILRDGRCLAARRGPSMSSAGRWELPGGKVRDGEEPRAALRRELAEELAVTIEVGERLGVGEAPSSDGSATIRLSIFEARIVAGTLELREHDAIRWLASDELDAVDWAAADRPVLPAIAARLATHPPQGL